MSIGVVPISVENGGNTVLPEWLGRRARLTPDKTAFVAEGRSWSFRQLDEAASRIARFVQHCLEAARFSPAGIGTGSDHNMLSVGPRVGVLMGNNSSFVKTTHALPKAGAVLVPLNTRLAPRELAWQLVDAGVSLLLHDERYRDLARILADKVPGLQRVAVADALAQGTVVPSPGDSLRRSLRLDDIHSIVYTSGTTGNPKGALLTFGNFWWNITGSALNLGVGRDDDWLACMPLFHVGGLSILLRSIVYGMGVTLHESFDAAKVNRAIDDGNVTLLSVVAVMLERMLAERGSEPYPQSLRAVLVGGGPVPAVLLRRALALGAPVLQTYGLTEAASQVATLGPDDGLRKLGSAGQPLFSVGLHILSPERRGGDGTELAPGEIGEIAVSGPTVSPGYWDGATGAPRVRSTGLFRTGDLGYVDEEGYLYVVDRRDDLFVSGGENVYPAEVEAVLTAHPSIAEAAVVGEPNLEWGRVPVAFVVAREGQQPTEEDIRRHCRALLAAYKVPERVVFVPELPRNAAGKLLRRHVREMVDNTAGLQDSG